MNLPQKLRDLPKAYETNLSPTFPCPKSFGLLQLFEERTTTTRLPEIRPQEHASKVQTTSENCEASGTNSGQRNRTRAREHDLGPIGRIRSMIDGRIRERSIFSH